MYQRARAPVHYFTPNEWLGGITKTKFNIVMIIITTVVTWKRATCVPGYRVARLEFKGFAQCFATCPYPRNSWHRDSRRKAWFLDHKSVAVCPFFPQKKNRGDNHILNLSWFCRKNFHRSPKSALPRSTFAWLRHHCYQVVHSIFPPSLGDAMSILLA